MRRDNLQWCEAEWFWARRHTDIQVESHKPPDNKDHIVQVVGLDNDIVQVVELDNNIVQGVNLDNNIVQDDKLDNNVCQFLNYHHPSVQFGFHHIHNIRLILQLLPPPPRVC